jgi:hypothetical protein
VDSKPVDGIAPVQRRRHAAGDFDHFGELSQAVGLIGRCTFSG